MWTVARVCRSGVVGARVGARPAPPARTSPVSCVLASIAKSTDRQALTMVRRASGAGGAGGGGGAARRDRLVGYWVATCGGMVFGAVVLGGVTRLTESGLSMVTWRLLGEHLPTSPSDWEREFALYQQYPEYKYMNQHMTLAEFKWIWYMEWAHRTWGRCIGAALLVPGAVFWARGFLDRAMKRRVLVYGALVAAQGLMGWHMVKSGLERPFEGPCEVPRVSQYRLAAHLSLALALYAALVSGALRLLRPPPAAAPAPALAPGAGPRPPLRALTALAHSVKGMAFLTAISGAFVAGLDAGLVYNSFPRMGDRWLPEDVLALQPAPRNLTENPSTVQFQHRVLGCGTLAAATVLAAAARRTRARGPALAVAAAAWLQASLGVLTLLHYVPTPLAAAHQAGSLVLLGLALRLTHHLKLLRYLPK